MLRGIDRKIKLAGAAVLAAMVFVGATIARPDTLITVVLGGNAHALQTDTGFPMGYDDQNGPIGGRQSGIGVTVQVGPVSVSCDDAVLELAHTVDVITSGRLFCPVIDASRFEILQAQIDASTDWAERRDHTTNARRAPQFGTSPEHALSYLGEAPPQGAVRRVPLYAWRGNNGLFVELNAAAHIDNGALPGFEMSFSWGTSCLAGVLADRLREDAKQRLSGNAPMQMTAASERALVMQDKLTDLCGKIE